MGMNKISKNKIETIFELLADTNNSVIFKINGLKDQLNSELITIYSDFKNLGLYNINSLNDLFNYIDPKSEIPEVFGLTRYLKLLSDDFTSLDYMSKQYIPLKIDNETSVFSLKVLRIVEDEECYCYLSRVDASFINIEQLYQDSYKDDLTNLFNRNALNLHLDYGNDEHYFGFFDLDGFKHINDTYSHSEGDKLLKQIGDRLIAISDNTVVYYRYGGDEFIFMTIGLDKPQVDELVDKIKKEILSIEFHGEKITASLGYMRYIPNSGVEQKNAIKFADIGMYHSKISGKGISTYVDENWINDITKKGLEEELNKYRILTRRD